MIDFRTGAALAALALTLTGCQVRGEYEKSSSETTAMALEELKGLPSLEDTKAAVRRAVDQIAAEGSRIVPGARWEDLHGDTSDNCERPYDQTGGGRYYLPDKVAQNLAVSEDQWRQFEAAARQAAKAAGAPTAMLMHNAPGDHDVSFIGPAGMSITIGYQGNLAISGYTGCRLLASKLGG